MTAVLETYLVAAIQLHKYNSTKVQSEQSAGQASVSQAKIVIAENGVFETNLYNDTDNGK